jgi:hypothetical protein
MEPAKTHSPTNRKYVAGFEDLTAVITKCNHYFDVPLCSLQVLIALLSLCGMHMKNIPDWMIVPY